MEKEFSAGAVVYRQEQGRTMFLLIYSRRNSIWGFPKGHIEEGESERDAALREIGEEAGITDLRFIDGFREENVYRTISNRGKNKGKTIEKHAIYLLARTESVKVVVDEGEISDYRWVDIQEARSLIAFESLKRVLENAAVNL
jgi:8-oxo-dGTP pyrophosphatase MutT (NUDIX family)